MTIMYDQHILQVMQSAVIDAVAASTMPDLPIKAVERTFVPPNDQRYVEIVFIPNNQSNYWGDEKNYAGMIRLVLHWPKNDEGAYPPMLVLASICSYFDKGTRLQDVTISDNPNLTGVLEEAGETLYPASIRYQCFKS